eukprot:5990424-Prymnesium_polylepis.1
MGEQPGRAASRKWHGDGPSPSSMPFSPRTARGCNPRCDLRRTEPARGLRGRLESREAPWLVAGWKRGKGY